LYQLQINNKKPTGGAFRVATHRKRQELTESTNMLTTRPVPYKLSHVKQVL